MFEMETGWLAFTDAYFVFKKKCNYENQEL